MDPSIANGLFALGGAAVGGVLPLVSQWRLDVRAAEREHKRQLRDAYLEFGAAASSCMVACNAAGVMGMYAKSLAEAQVQNPARQMAGMQVSDIVAAAHKAEAEEGRLRTAMTRVALFESSDTRVQEMRAIYEAIEGVKRAYNNQPKSSGVVDYHVFAEPVIKQMERWLMTVGKATR